MMVCFLDPGVSKKGNSFKSRLRRGPCLLLAERPHLRSEVLLVEALAQPGVVVDMSELGNLKLDPGRDRHLLALTIGSWGCIC